MIEEIPYQDSTDVSKRSIIMTWEELHQECGFFMAMGFVIGMGVLTIILGLSLIFS